MSFSRFAVFYVPPAGDLADFGATWLGWDIATGRAVRQPDLPDLENITSGPRRYGFHATLKPPFRLTQGRTVEQLSQACEAMAAGLAPANCDGLTLTALGRFLALTPLGDAAGITRIAAACVADLDMYRAPPDPSEMARRRKSHLTARQDMLLVKWGYPYVMDQFRCHMTLTGRIPKPQVAHWAELLNARLPDSNVPFVVNQIALCGERPDGHFELLRRFLLAG